MKVNCCVPYCYSSRPRYAFLNFHRLPTDPKRRKKWTNLVRNKTLKLSRWTSVCSLHFRNRCRGKNDLPVYFPWSYNWKLLVQKYNKDKNAAFAIQRDHDYISEPSCRTPDLPCVIPPNKTYARPGGARNTSIWQKSRERQVEEIVPSQLTSVLARVEDTAEIPKVDGPYYLNTFLPADDVHETVTGLLSKLRTSNDVDPRALHDISVAALSLVRNMKEIGSIRSKVEQIHKFGIKRFESSDDDIRFWTGFYSYGAFMCFYQGMIAPNTKKAKYWGAMNSEMEKEKTGPRRSLPVIDEVFLTMVKLKRGSANKDLAERFNLSESHVSRIFTTFIKLIANVFSVMNIWLPRGKVKKYMPSCFRPLYQDVRVIIDCTEIRCEKPSDFEAQAATYSHYKSTNTVKGMVGMSPSGVPTFVSDLFEGSISDNAITFRAGFLNKLDVGDMVMADRGWTCKDSFARHGVRLVTPHFLHSRKQMPVPQLAECVTLARLRVHVERCIGRIKQWQMLNQVVPLSYWKMLNDIWKVCAGLVLFWPPLLDSE